MVLDKIRSLFRKGSPSAAPLPSLTEIRSSFEQAAQDEEHFPSTIDPRIYHVRLLSRYLPLEPGTRALDAGCGKGRFARVLLEEHPGVHMVTLDLAMAMLAQCAPPLAPACGTLTQLPFADASFQSVYATESLEHAVDIEAAVAELCRVLAPGGRLVIIDKNVEHWGRFDTPAWEKWFRREELEKLLRRHCRQVSSEFISYWEDVPPDGLFLAWKAEK